MKVCNLDFRLSNVVKELLTLKPIQSSIKNNGFIAGGFAKDLFLNDYSALNDALLKLSERGGDIDLFFHDEESLKKAILEGISFDEEFIISNSGAKSAFNWMDQKNHLKFQFVKCVFGKPTEILGSFDFENSKFAITGDQVIFSEKALGLEAQRSLLITKFRSTLSWRMKKYLHNFHYEKLDESCYQQFIDYVLANKDNVSIRHLIASLIKTNKLSNILTIEDKLLLTSIWGTSGTEYYKYLMHEDEYLSLKEPSNIF